MVRFLFDKIEDIKANGATNTLEEIAEAGRKVYCNLYQNNPGWVFMKNNLTIPVVKRALDSICAEPGFTPPTFEKDVPFQGGQCCDVTYDHRLNYSYERCDGVTRNRSWANRATGKIIGGYMRANPSNPSRIQWGTVVEKCDGSLQYIVNEDRGGSIVNGASCPPPGTSGNSSRFKSESFTWNIVDVIVFGGGDPLACGSPEGDYPEYSPPNPDGSDTTTTVDVTNSDGDINTYNVTVNFDNDLEIKLPGSINVNNTNVTIDVGGITIGEDRPDAPSQGDDDDPVTTYLPQPVSVPAPELVEEPATEEEEEAEGLVALKVSITAIPANESLVQSGQNLFKIYAGWVVFKEGSYHHPRQFIDFEESIFYAPENADGYIVYLKEGYTGVVTKVVESTN